MYDVSFPALNNSAMITGRLPIPIKDSPEIYGGTFLREETLDILSFSVVAKRRRGGTEYRQQ